MTPKELFQQNKALCNQHNAAVNEPWFQHALAYAKAEVLEREVTAEMLKGAKLLEEVFITLSELPGDPITFSTGINHDVDVPTPKQPTKE